MPATPFTDPQLIAPLYATAGRLAQRTGALHAAKISGEDATATITDLAAQVTPTNPVVCDIGCGRGTTTLALTSPTPTPVISAVTNRVPHVRAIPPSPVRRSGVRRPRGRSG
jgi:hypothetical protein